MIWKKLSLCILYISFWLLISINASHAEVNKIQFNKEKSKINYTLSYLGVPVKRKSLPASGQLVVEGFNNEITTTKLPLLKRLDLNVKFTSKNPIFKKAINYDKYPDFSFLAELENPVQLNNKRLVELEGDLSFHGVTKKIKIKLKNRISKDNISLTGFFNIKMTDFGITQPRIFFIVLDNVIKTKVELHTNQNVDIVD